MSKRQAILLIGPTGSGKTPLGDWLQDRGLGGRTCHHFDFGANLREVLATSGSSDFTDSEIRFVRDVLERGALLEDETFGLAEKILRAFFARRRVAARDLVILNGLPRHAGQARAIGRTLDVVAVIHLECDARTVLQRLRRNTGGDRTGRADDSGRLVRQKLVTYAERTAPLLEHYRARGVPIAEVKVAAATKTEELAERVRAGLARQVSARPCPKRQSVRLLS